MTQEQFQEKMQGRSKEPPVAEGGDNADAAAKAAKALIEGGKAGKLKPLEPLCVDLGCSPEELLVRVQKDPAFAGKTPQEIADMVAADPSMMDKLKALVGGNPDAAADAGEGDNPDAEGDVASMKGSMTNESFADRMSKKARM